MAKATGPTYIVPFRRRRENVTNYAKRLAMVKSGTRLVVRKSLKNVLVQFIDFSDKGDKVLAQASSAQLAKFGWFPHSNTPTAYLTGLLAGKRAAKSGVKSACLDIGLYTPSKGSRVFAALKGVLDAGIKVPSGEGLSSETRLKGEHIAAYAKSLKGTPDYEKRFSVYIKQGVSPENLPDLFEKVKGGILSKSG